MENPNNGGSGGPRGSNDLSSNAVWSGGDHPVSAAASASNEQRRGIFRERHENPHVQAQVQRIFPSYMPPLYVRVRGYSQERSLEIVERMATSFVQPLGRQFTDTEMQAFGEHVLSGINTGSAFRWACTSLAAYMTFRGRKSFRFPFFRVQAGGVFDPFIGGPQVRGMWHMARFGAYYTICAFFVLPVAEVSNSINCLASMKKDPRLADLMRESALAGHAMLRTADDPWSASPTSLPPSWTLRRNPDRTLDGTDESVAAQAQGAWSALRQHQPPQEAHPSERSEKWAPFPDDFDDASPVASSMCDGPDNRPSDVTAWDRIRQQSQSQSEQSVQQPQQSWQAPQGIGAGDDNAGPQYRGPQDNYSYSSADEERVVAKGQAQKEFDEMLERERRGVELEPKSWGRK